MYPACIVSLIWSSVKCIVVWGYVLRSEVDGKVRNTALFYLRRFFRCSRPEILTTFPQPAHASLAFFAGVFRESSFTPPHKNVLRWRQIGHVPNEQGTGYEHIFFLVTNIDWIDLMHNDVKQCFCGSNVHYGNCSHARIQYGVVFPRSGKFKWQKRRHVLMWLGRRVAARRNCLSFQIGQILPTFTVPHF